MAGGVCRAWDAAVTAGVPACPVSHSTQGLHLKPSCGKVERQAQEQHPGPETQGSRSPRPTPEGFPCNRGPSARTMLTSVLMPSCALSSRLSEQLCTTWPCSCSELSLHRPSQVALEVKNPPGNAGEVRDPRSIPGSKRSPGGEHATRSSILVEHPTVRGVGGRPSMGSQRGGHA